MKVTVKHVVMVLLGAWLVLFAASTVAVAVLSGGSVSATAGAVTPSSVAPGQTATASLNATATSPTVSGEGCTPLNAPTWSWSANNGQVNISQPSPSSPAATMSGTFTSPGTYNVTATATATWTDACGDKISVSGSTNVVFTVVGVQKIQFQLPGGSWTDMPSPALYVATGTTVNFQAIPTPAGASWPSGYPTWGGTCGASGTGATTSVTLNVPSTSMTDYQTITATCGNTVSGDIIRYGPDKATLTVGWDPNNPENYIATATYTLWQTDNNGVPGASGGNVILSTVDFEQQTDFTLSPVVTWTFSNGVPATQTYVIASGVQDCSSNINYSDGDTPVSLNLKLRNSGKTEGSYLARLTRSQEDVHKFYQVIQFDAAKMEKQLWDQTLQLIAIIRAAGGQRQVAVNPAQQTSAGVDNASGVAISLQMNTQAWVEKNGFIWFRNPNVTAQITATPNVVAVKGVNYAPITVGHGISRADVAGLSNSRGWLQQNQWTFALEPLTK